MNAKKSLQLKLIQNFSYRKEKLSVPLRNKDYYLFNLLNKKTKEKDDYLKLSIKENNKKPVKKVKKIMKLNELNINSCFEKIELGNKNQDGSFKNTDNNMKYVLIKNNKKFIRNNSSHFILRDKADKFETSNKIKNPLIITSFKKINGNNNTKNKLKNKSNKLKLLKNSFAHKIFNYNEIKQLDENYFISNSIKIDYSKLKKNEGTQINLDHIKFKKHKNITNISRNKYCSPNSIRFKREFKKFKSLDNNGYI